MDSLVSAKLPLVSGRFVRRYVEKMAKMQAEGGRLGTMNLSGDGDSSTTAIRDIAMNLMGSALKVARQRLFSRKSTRGVGEKGEEGEDEGEEQDSEANSIPPELLERERARFLSFSTCTTIESVLGIVGSAFNKVGSLAYVFKFASDGMPKSQDDIDRETAAIEIQLKEIEEEIKKLRTAIHRREEPKFTSTSERDKTGKVITRTTVVITKPTHGNPTPAAKFIELERDGKLDGGARMEDMAKDREPEALGDDSSGGGGDEGSGGESRAAKRVRVGAGVDDVRLEESGDVRSGRDPGVRKRPRPWSGVPPTGSPPSV
jgi:hypothetical protein